MTRNRAARAGSPLAARRPVWACSGGLQRGPGKATVPGVVVPDDGVRRRGCLVGVTGPAEQRAAAFAEEAFAGGASLPAVRWPQTGGWRRLTTPAGACWLERTGYAAIIAVDEGTGGPGI